MWLKKKNLEISILRRKNFTPEEFVFSNIAQRDSIDNSVYDPYVLANLNRTADKAQEMRDFLGHAIYPNSFYRCLKLNRAVGSRDNSQHIKGQAGDFTCPGFGSPLDIYLALKDSGIEFDQCILEKSWIHFSIRERGANRNQFIVL